MPRFFRYRLDRIPRDSYCFHMEENRPPSIQDGEKIRELRKSRLKVNASQFARRLGIKPQSMINIERGRRSASLALLIQIARELDEPVDALLREAA